MHVRAGDVRADRRRVVRGQAVTHTGLRRRRIAGGALLALVSWAAWIVLATALTPLPGPLREGKYARSVRFLDRNGELLREVRADDDKARATWVPSDELDGRIA